MEYKLVTKFFTRDGSFTVDAQGNLKTRAGYLSLPGLSIPPNTKSLNIAEDGKVQAFLTTQTEPVDLGQIPVFTLLIQQGCQIWGVTLAKKTTASGEPIQNVAGNDNAGFIQQGSLESSNVSVMNEMTGLLKLKELMK